MKKVNFTEPNNSSWRNWRANCENATKRLSASVRRGDRPKINKPLYKFKKELYFGKNGPFQGRCAYCEAPLNRFDDLDHFRPIKKVTDIEDKTITIRDHNGQVVEHPGYYWLAYFWKNLLPCCSTCNRISIVNSKKIGKGNRFPLAGGQRAISPGEEKKEKALLLNPLFDFPKRHFTWVNDKGLICGKTRRGKACIKIFGFHLRENLLQEWGKAYQRVITEYASHLLNPNRRKKIQELRKELHDSKREYSFVALAALQEIDSL